MNRVNSHVQRLSGEGRRGEGGGGICPNNTPFVLTSSDQMSSQVVLYRAGIAKIHEMPVTELMQPTTTSQDRRPRRCCCCVVPCVRPCATITLVTLKKTSVAAVRRTGLIGYEDGGNIRIADA